MDEGAFVTKMNARSLGDPMVSSLRGLGKNRYRGDRFPSVGAGLPREKNGVTFLCDFSRGKPAPIVGHSILSQLFTPSVRQRAIVRQERA
jgi:hypothetical protein